MKNLNNKLFILFGKSGAGKNYVAEIIEKEFNLFFYDGDIDLTSDMVTAIRNKKGFTEKMRENYYKRIKNCISELLNTHNSIVFTQGLFKNKHRIELSREFPFAEFILIESDNDIIYKRVEERNNFVTAEYANKINKYFEEPDFECMKIINNLGTNEILMQIRELGLDEEYKLNNERTEHILNYVT